MTEPQVAAAWTPLRLTFPTRGYAFGDNLIRERLGKRDAQTGHAAQKWAETWEVSDYGPPEDSATVLEGPGQGGTLRDLVTQFPAELVGPGFTGPYFPLLAKFLDASHRLPVHLHANDATARRKYGQANGKTEAWHIVWAAPGATILAGIRPGTTPEQLRTALREGRYDDVMPRHPIRSGDTVYVPGGVLHSFGPDALVYEIQQTSDLGVSAMPEDLYGQPYDPATWDANIEAVLDDLVWEPLPRPQPGLILPAAGAERRLCALGPYFALERLRVTGSYRWSFGTAQIVSALTPLTLHAAGQDYALGAGETLLLPAALAGARLSVRGEAGEALLSYVPDRQTLVAELRQVGHSDAEISALGEVGLPEAPT